MTAQTLRTEMTAGESVTFLTFLIEKLEANMREAERGISLATTTEDAEYYSGKLWGIQESIVLLKTQMGTGEARKFTNAHAHIEQYATLA